MIPAPFDLSQPIGVLVPELAGHLGEHETVDLACELLGGADPTSYAVEIAYLTGHAGDHAGWTDYWPRVWGARALLYVWHDSAEPAVINGLDDDSWRVAEMCLKVSSRRELPRAGDGAARLARHELSRVRAQAARLLGLHGDTEHIAAVQGLVDDTDAAVRRAAVRALDLMAVRLDRADL